METVRAGLEIDRFHLLGQSWGGVLGLEYMLAYPSRIVSFIGADTAFDLPAMERGFERKKQALGTETYSMMALHEASDTTAHPEYQAAVTMLMYRHVCRLKNWPEALTWCLENLGTEVFSAMFGPHFFQCTGTIRTFDRMDRLATIKTPVLLVHGEHDYIEPQLAVRAKDSLPNAELAFFAGCSHMPFFEDPGRYIAALSDFLVRHKDVS
jgi:proline iminopeptidase